VNWLQKVTGNFSEDDLPVVLLLIAFATFACIIPPQADTFYHLRSGREMWQAGTLLTRELFSWTEYGQPLPNHWWFGQLIFYGLFQLGGPVLLTVVAGSIAFAALVMSWSLTRGRDELRILMLVALALTLPEWSVRPQVFSLLLTVIALRLVIADRPVVLIMVLVLWANVHAVVALGIGIASVPLLDAILWNRSQIRSRAAIAAAAMVTPLATPLGVRFWPWLIDTVRLSRGIGLSEYRAPLTLEPVNVAFWAFLGTFGVVLFRHRTELSGADRATRVMVLASLLLALPAVTSTRNVPFFVLVAAPAISRLLSAVRTRRRKRPTRVAWGMVAVALTVGVIAIVARWSNDGATIGWKPMSPSAVAAVQTCPEPIYNGLYEGGYLIWFVPKKRVFIDGRVDVYPRSLLLRAQRADVYGEYRELFSEYGIRCAVTRSQSPLFTALRNDPTMQLAFHQDGWGVFTR
jgi:hypothetical protein